MEKMKHDNCKNASSSSKCVHPLRSSDHDVLNHILCEVQEIKTCMGSRLTSLELKVSVLVQTCNKISTKLDSFEKFLEKNFEEENVTGSKAPGEEEKLSSKLKIVPLSSENDFPNGSWLGDPKSVANRVRCNISPQCMIRINSSCFTPVKMALALLDNLFSREELAISNISGRSRWGKKQLNPLLIYGIKVHLKSKFFISEKDWHKICQNMDAKCRFAWKRSRRIGTTNKTKSKLKVAKQEESAIDKKPLAQLPNTEGINFDFEHLNHSNLDFNSCVKVITQSPCELRILNATPAQIAHLQESQEIILAEEMLPDSNDAKQIMINNTSEVSMNTVVMDGVVDDIGPDLTISQSHDSNNLQESKYDQSTQAHHHQDSLTMHESQLGEGLEVQLDHASQVDTDG